MDELLAAAAKATGMSENMVKRSATARAKAQGTTVEAVLAEWAGVPVPAAAASAPAATEPAAEAAAAETAIPAEVAAPAAETAAPTEVAESEPAEVAETEPASDLEIEESGEEVAPTPAAPAPVAAVREVVPSGAIPRWLAGLFVAVPLFALTYLAFVPNGPACGDAGSLAVDPVTGEMVNCDGTAIGGEGETDYFALGLEVYGSSGCIACHGEGGAGAGDFPAFTEGALLATFPEGSCSTHIEWIRLGTAQWPEPTYGANNKPVGGSGAVMPTFGSQLSDEEVKAVALYERVAFGGQSLEAAMLDCVGAPTEAEAAAEG